MAACDPICRFTVRRVCFMVDGPQTLLRHWTMLKLIPAAPRKIDVARIIARLEAQGFTPTARTIQRDLQKLSVVFPLICDERSKPFGWSWMPGADAIDIPAMSPQAALALRLAREHLAPVLPPTTLAALDPHLRKADRVLAEVATAVSSWPDKVRVISPTQPFQPPDVDPVVLEAVYRAVLDERVLTLRYRKREADEAREYEVHPLALVGRDNVMYVVGALWNYDNAVQLALHRVEAAQVGEPRRAVAFDLDDYIARGEFGFLIDESVDLVLRVDAVVVPKLEETPLADNQTVEAGPDGAAIVRATVPETSQLRGWILSYGPLIEVLEPSGMRAEIAGRLAAAAAQYK